MVNPRWRPTIANSRIPGRKKKKDTTQQDFSIPETEEYIGTHIKSD